MQLVLPAVPLRVLCALLCASLRRCRARLIGLFTVPLGIPSSSAASRVLSPSSTVAWTTASSSGESRCSAAPTSPCSTASSTASSAEGTCSCRCRTSRSNTDLRVRSRLSSVRMAMPHSQAATSPCPW